MRTHPITQLTLIALLILAFALPAAAQGPAPDEATTPSALDVAPPSPGAAPRRTPDGQWFMPVDSRSQTAAAAAPQDSGGPDSFGYTWYD